MVAVPITALTAPSQFFVDGYSRYVHSGDIRALTSGDPPAATPPAEFGEKILRYYHRACGVAGVYKGAGEGTRLDFLSRADSLVCRMLMEKPLGNYQDKCPTLTHLAEVLYDECKKTFKSQMPVKVWTEIKAVDESQPAQPSAAPARKKEDLEPRLIVFDSDGNAMNEQDSFEESKHSSACDWSSTLKSSTLEYDILKAELMNALTLVDNALLEGAKSRIEVRRWSTGEVQVFAKEQLQVHAVALAPMVCSMSFFALSSKKGGLPPGAVRLSGFGPRASGAKKKVDIAAGAKPEEAAAPEEESATPEEAAAPEEEIDDLAILPCNRLPPRGVEFERYDKPVFVHPFWAIERKDQSKDSEKINCEMVDVSVDSVMTAGFGPLSLTCKGQSSCKKLNIPVLTNTQVIR